MLNGSERSSNCDATTRKDGSTATSSPSAWRWRWPLAGSTNFQGSSPTSRDSTGSRRLIRRAAAARELVVVLLVIGSIGAIANGFFPFPLLWLLFGLFLFKPWFRHRFHQASRQQ